MSPDRRQRRRNLERLLRPRHVAIVGNHLVADAVAVCRQYGYSGPIWPVSRSLQEADGIPCFENIDALPEGPDATLILASREATNDTVAALATRGGGGVVCYAGGYAEAGAQGRKLQNDLIETAGDLAVVGPNCNGLANFLDDLVLWPNPELPVPKSQRGVAVLAQSGAFLVNVCNAERALPVVFAASIGNQAMVDAADFMDMLVGHDRIAAIGLYLESVRDADTLARAAYAAALKDIPIVVLKSGRTPEGQATAVTHTGALVGSDELASAFFEKFAIHRVTRVSEFVETLKCMTTPRRCTGNRLAAIAVSGGIATMVADAASRSGLELAAHEPSGAANIARHLPAHLSVANPLDCSPPLSAPTGLSMANQDALEDCFTAAVSGEHEMAALFIDFPRADREQHHVWRPAARAFTKVAQRVDKVLAVMSMLPEGLPEEIRAELAGGGVLPLQGLDDGLAALAALAAGHQHRETLRGQNVDDLLASSPARVGHTRLLDEAASKRRLAKAGLPVVAGLVTGAGEAVHAGQQLGYPVVVKALSEALPHKAMYGGVALGLEEAGAIEHAVRRIADSLKRTVGLDIDRFLIEPMIEAPAEELFVGVKYDEVWGPAIVLGTGGMEVDDTEDRIVLLMPVTETGIKSALAETRVGRRLTRSRVPMRRLEETLARVARFAMDEQNVVELDINPLFIHPDGEVMVVDALLRVVEGRPLKIEGEDAITG